ncbi:peptide-methionine (S)-S-oxide reductase MsrA [Pricia sp. S334]|uniref:Peptide methionine sulfoxide reductase MsrA n=1 Tax=Pricia mediterranea TaxID=3076079 RepID=A0ABU3L9E8_9FLAO|nr:peptide-methionine (S)-S-oxide reductase MsrA [Pricia sp. S334]MDT7829824.1 peptide-methionine (S)-S-oxide reductase MsrA [Pricia sp. S334]
MKIFGNTILVLALALTYSCQSSPKKNKAASSEKDTANHIQNPTAQELDKLETAYFASGCFWCVEAIFESVKGVKEVVSGYAGGSQANPTYEQVAGGRTDHAEAVKVYYDPEVISFTALVQVFFGSHDPTTLNRQGPDRGPQYRSIAFYQNDREKEIIEGYIKALKEQKVYQGEPITTEVTALSKFYEAEDYHQDYERKNPNNSYITNVSVPRLNRFKANFSDYLKEEAH